MRYLVLVSILLSGCVPVIKVESPNDGIVNAIITQRYDYTDQTCRSFMGPTDTLDNGGPVTNTVLLVGCWNPEIRIIFLSYEYPRRKHEYCHALGRPKEECAKIKE